MLQVERLGVVLYPPKGDDAETFPRGRKGEYAVFNAGMVLKDGIVHMLYRIARNRILSTMNRTDRRGEYEEDCIGHAMLTPEGKLIKDCGKVIEPDNQWDFSGVQDPRIIFFEGKYYICYCAYNADAANENNPEKARMGFAVTADFANYRKLGMIDIPTWDKDHFIFPERIGGKVCLVHRIEPEIYMDYFDSIDSMLNAQSWKNYDAHTGRSIKIKREFPWESLKIGGGVPPIRTEKGWIFIYHGVSKPKGKLCYCAGAALLDLKHPERIVSRLPYPILAPEAEYEKFGDVDDVVFPVGGYIYKGKLYISYGGADKVVAIARIGLDELMTEFDKYSALAENVEERGGEKQ